MTRLRLPAALLLGGFLVGCLGQPAPVKRRYVLDVRPARVHDPGSRGVVQLNRVRVAPLFERKGLVYRTGDERYEADFYNEFYSPPGEMVREALEQWLMRSGVFSDVIQPSMRAEPDWWLDGRVDKIYADVRNPDAPEAVLETEWVLVNARARNLPVVFEKSYSSVVALRDREPATVVEGLRRALVSTFEQLDGDLERALEHGARPAGQEEAGRR